MADDGAPAPTGSVLLAASKHIGSYCNEQSMTYMKCKAKDQNPEACLKQGEAVSRCVLNLLKHLHSVAPDEMNGYSKCMDYYSTLGAARGRARRWES
mmetsp:Transcript_19779/g.62931  ORF Transcript_19779/g.62931 Transcript_19779/m.62931 type:complete len:97 (+) Transcript_19779:201-491(+)